MSEAHALQPHDLAPWAEVVPRSGLLTVADLLALPEDGWQYELVEARLVRMPSSGGEASSIGAVILMAVLAFVRAHNLGRVTGEAGGYTFGPPGKRATTLAPDVAFVRADRVPPRSSPVYEKAWPLAPDLAVEVASPTQYRPAMARKAERYLAAGTRLVWIVWPKRQQIDVWRPGGTQPAVTLNLDESLDGEDVLPGFSFSVADIFA